MEPPEIVGAALESFAERMLYRCGKEPQAVQAQRRVHRGLLRQAPSNGFGLRGLRHSVEVLGRHLLDLREPRLTISATFFVSEASGQFVIPRSAGGN